MADAPDEIISGEITNSFTNADKAFRQLLKWTVKTKLTTGG